MNSQEVEAFLNSEEVKELKMDHEKFFDTINSNNLLTVLLKAHLFIESNLVRLIKKELVNEEAIDFSRVNFPLKLQLCVALGIYEEKDLPAYLKLNKLRNDVAHKLHFEVEEKDIKSFLSTLNADQIKYALIEEGDSLMYRFRKALASMYL